MKPVTIEDVRHAAVEAVETDPGVEAVILYGSRARGTAHPHSDWDIAILSRGDAAEVPTVQALFGRLERVNPIVLRARSVRENCNRAGTLEAAVARQGRMLAGVWVRPHCRKEYLDLDPDEFRHNHEVAIEDIRGAVSGLCNAALLGRTYVPNMVELSQQAAEAVAKSVIAGFGLSPATVHDLDELAVQLETAYRGRRHGEEDRKRFACLIRELNGDTLAAHTARYSLEPVEKPERTADRLVDTMRLQVKWIRYYSGQHPGMEEVFKNLCQLIERTSRRLEREEGFDRLLPPLRAATISWGNDAESIARDRGLERAPGSHR